MIENLQKPAKLEFRIVKVDSSVRQPTEENEDWTDDEGILYRSMIRSDAEPNEGPIWVQQLSSADGDIVKEAFPVKIKWEDGKSDWISPKKAEKSSQISLERSLKCLTRLPEPPEGLQSFWTISWKAPTVKQRIDGGSAVISGNFSYREAKLLSDILNNPLKVSLEIGEKYEVSPTLATSALDSSLSACYLGAFLVIAFMILWYRSGGFVAVFSVGTNVLLVVALLAGIFQATFTLPGMAALVLTIGMAVDANILIFERIREELRAGKSTENALEGGYAKAFSTIIDANLTTLITASILIWLGTGP